MPSRPTDTTRTASGTHHHALQAAPRVLPFVEGLVQGEQATDAEQDDRDDEGVDVAVATVAERVLGGGRPAGPPSPDEQQQLVERVSDRVDRLGQHRGEPGEGERDELGQRDPEVRKERGDDGRGPTFGGHGRHPTECRALGSAYAVRPRHPALVPRHRSSRPPRRAGRRRRRRRAGRPGRPDRPRAGRHGGVLCGIRRGPGQLGQLRRRCRPPRRADDVCRGHGPRDGPGRRQHRRASPSRCPQDLLRPARRGRGPDRDGVRGDHPRRPPRTGGRSSSTPASRQRARSSWGAACGPASSSCLVPRC